MENVMIENGNKLIAEFMGWKDVVHQSFGLDISTNFSNSYKRFDSPDGKTSLSYYHDDFSEALQYHKSWDWLMPVVEKISKTHLQNWDGTECTEAIDTCYPVTFNMPDENGNVMFRFKGFSLHTGKSLIDITWQAVVEFIEWHNKQNA